MSEGMNEFAGVAITDDKLVAWIRNLTRLISCAGCMGFDLGVGYYPDDWRCYGIHRCKEPDEFIFIGADCLW